MLEPFALIPLGLLIFCLFLKLYGVWVAYLFTQVLLFLLAILLLGLEQKKIIQITHSVKN